MNKAELTDHIAEVVDIPKTVANQVIDTILAAITNSLKNGESVDFVGFGSFKPGDRAERKGRHPQTGAEMLIPAARVAKFKAGKKLKDALNAKDTATE